MRNNILFENKLSILIFLEFIIYFYLGNKLEFVISPIILTAISLIIANLFLHQKSNIKTEKEHHFNTKYGYTIFVFLIISFSVWAYFIIQHNPIDIKTSDIIPYINDLYLKRLFNGEYIYNLAPGLGYGNWTPNYLTFHWLPFAVSYYFHFDHRWIVLFTFFIATFIYQFHFIKSKNNADYILKAILPFVFLFNIFLKQSSNFSHTVELLIASYYFILGMFLIKNNLLGKSIGIMLTLLSRYIIIFYIPIAFIIELYLNKAKLIKQLLLILALISLFYIIPFMIKDPAIFFKGMTSYDLAALGEWNGQSWQQPNDRPHQLFQGLGFASWAYSFLNGSIENKIQIFKLLMLCIICLTFIFISIYFIKNKYKFPAQNWHLSSLKIIICLVVSFSPVPYAYLFWNNLIISIIMLGSLNNLAPFNTLNK